MHYGPKMKLMRKAIAVSAAAMCAAAAVPTAVFANSYKCECDFDDGVALPWHICETAPAKMVFNVNGGSFNVRILNPGGSGIDANGSTIKGAEQRGGDSRWDLQIRNSRLRIEAGHTYKLHWELESDSAGEINTQINAPGGVNEGVWQNNQSNWSQGWNNVLIELGKNSFDSEFTADKTLEVAEWAFSFGGAGPYQASDCFPEGTQLKFDNLSIECTTCAEAYGVSGNSPCVWDPDMNTGVVSPQNDVRVNQLGYFPDSGKKATYVSSLPEPPEKVGFKLVNDRGEAVFSGEAECAGKNEGDSDYCYILDFSEYRTPGRYTVVVEDSTQKDSTRKVSHEFGIGDDIYSGILKNTMNYYYQNRSGIDTEEKYITSYNHADTKSKLAHKDQNAIDVAYIQSDWKLRNSISSFEKIDQYDKIDVSGGWYEADNTGKNITSGAMAVWLMQNMYERSKVRGTDGKWADESTMVIPDDYTVSRNKINCKGYPDILDEARYELEFMFRMIVDADKDRVWGKSCENMVYHRVTDKKPTGIAETPYIYIEDYMNERIVEPPTYAATFQMTACAAQAARLWKGIDDDFAKECLDNAKKSWEAVMKKREQFEKGSDRYNEDKQFAPYNSFYGDIYADWDVTDDAYWAACELFSTTGDEEYYDYLKGYSFGGNEHDKAFDVPDYVEIKAGYFNSPSAFGSTNLAGLGTLSLCLNDGMSAEDRKTIRDNILRTADVYLSMEEKTKNGGVNGMGLPYEMVHENFMGGLGYGLTGYEYGSNYLVGNNSMIMAYAYDLTKDRKYLDGITQAMDYLFGRNGLGISYVTGSGAYHVNYPRHRYWAYEVDNDFPMAPDGVLTSGPFSGLTDAYVGSLGMHQGEVPPQKCFVDSVEAESVNTPLLEGQAVFAWNLSFIEDELGETVPVTTTTTTGTGTTTTATTTYVQLQGELPGDANCDGSVDMADAVLIMQSISNPNKYGLSGTDNSHITEKGRANADVDGYPNGVTSADAVRIQEYLLGKISVLGQKK